MTTPTLSIGPLRPSTVRQIGSSVLTSTDDTGIEAVDAVVQMLRQEIGSMRDQIESLNNIITNVGIQVPMLIASGGNHQAGVVPDPGATAGALKFLREDATWSLLTIATLPQLSRSLAYKSAVQSIADSTHVALTFDTNVADVGGIHSTSVNPTRFTAVATGWHIAQAQIGFAGSAAGTIRQVGISVNGSFVVPVPIARNTPMAVGFQSIVQVAATLSLTAGDYVEFKAFQDSGGALNTYSDGTFGSLTFVSR